MLHHIILFSIYIIPVLALFYCAIDIYNRNRRNTEYKLASLIILCFMMMFIGEYIRQLSPLKYSAIIVNDWVESIGALLICMAIHFNLKITHLSEKMPKWLYLIFSYILLVPTVLYLFVQKNIYNGHSFFHKGYWNQQIFDRQYLTTLSIGIGITILYGSLLGVSCLKAKTKIEQKRLGVLFFGTIITLIIDVIIAEIHPDNLPPYPYIFSDSIWILFLRWSMVKYNLLPSYIKRFHVLFDFMPTAVLVSDRSGRVLETNPAAKLLLGDKLDSLYDLCSPWNRDILEKFFTNAFSSKKKITNYELVMRSWDDKSFNALLDADFVEIAEEDAVILLIRDVTERQKYKEHLEYLAYHDILTDLPERRMFTNTLQMYLEQYQEFNRIAVLYLDCDNFKQINDTMGHDSGDEFLVVFAERMKSCVSKQQVLARFGGDEFVVLLPEITTEKEAIAKAEQILVELKNPFCIDGSEFYVTCSIGISMSNGIEKDASTLIRYADIAMYEAKKAGRNTYRIFENAILRTVILESQLRRALDNKEFFLEFQPQLDFRTGRINGFEALIRWNHPELGVISPEEFIFLAEKTGAIVEIGNWVLETACKEAVTWGKDIHIAVNVSTRQIRKANFADNVKEALESSGLSAQQLMLEITESALFEDTQVAKECLNAVQKLGVQLALDDFGTGYSSLSYLTQFPIDVIKIDRSFVQNLLDDMKKLSVMKALIIMCNLLKIIVLVEGIETHEQMESLRNMGCDAAQGYLWGRPVRKQFVKRMIKQIYETTK